MPHQRTSMNLEAEKKEAERDSKTQLAENGAAKPFNSPFGNDGVDVGGLLRLLLLLRNIGFSLACGFLRRTLNKG